MMAKFESSFEYPNEHSDTESESSELSHDESLEARESAEEKAIESAREHLQGFSIKTDGAEVTWHGQKHDPLPRGFSDDAEERGRYASNNSVVTWVNERGEQFVSFATDRTYESLQALGYEEGYFWVPMSNGEKFVDADLQSKWDRMLDELMADRERKHQEAIAKIAEERGIKPMIESERLMNMSIQMDGVATEHTIAGGEYREGTPAGTPDKMENIGRYFFNNGIVTWVNEKGEQFVTYVNDETMQSLADMGYLYEPMWVPMSNGEKFVDEDKQAHWKAMWHTIQKEEGNKNRFTGKPIEPKKPNTNVISMYKEDQQ